MREWAARLRRIAEPVLAGTPLVGPATEEEKRRFVETFEDEEGHRRVWDGFLLGWMLGVRVEPVGEAWLWSWERLACGAVAGSPRAEPPHFALPGAWALEQETEKELAGLHAWWWVARGAKVGAWGSGGAALYAGPNSPSGLAEPRPPPPLGAGEEGAALAAGAAWVMANIQPDNATGHPWGIQVFLERAEGDPQARHYAETMLHNCLVHRGTPDRFSAVILLDAARGLEALG